LKSEGQPMPPEKILELYRMGFKPIPILPDGVTPSIAWTEIYENGWGENELSRTEFPNVATCFGRTHLKDENNRDLYLNCLDVDSKEVYDRLCIVTDVNNNERFLISELRKHTYVVKTRKPYGLHIYWLSHMLNSPRHRFHCRVGFEFELKTDKSSAHAALPESHHRDDANFHYSNIGQNTIMLSDSLYGEIVSILDDCIIKKHTRNYNNTSTGRELSERDIEKIIDSLSDFYVMGFRDLICYGISGFFYKNGISLQTTSKVIYELGKQDEELKSRLAVARQTYSKDVNDVSGRRLLLATLKSSCNDEKRATDVILNIMKILNPSLNEPSKIEYNRVAEELIKEYDLKTMKDTQELFYYDDTTHIYTNYGEVLIRKELELLIPLIGTRSINEIIQKIKRRTPISRAQFDCTNLTNVENGFLNPLTGELISHSPKILTLNLLPLKYNPNAKCPETLKFLSSVLPLGNIITFLQFLGYCLLKTAKYEKALILLGRGDNGKSILLKLIEAFLGLENTSHVSLKDLSEDKFAKADLFGKMANTCGDLESYKILDSSGFKMLVSGDSIRAQKKGQDAFFFRNHAKLIFSTNQFPNVSDAGYSWYKRLIVLLFPNTFADDKDVDIIDKIITDEELSGLLNLVIRALRQLVKVGRFANVKDPRDVRKHFDEGLKYVQDFIKVKCVLGSTLSDNSSRLYAAYCSYCQTNKITSLADSTFGACLTELGIKKGRRMKSGNRNYVNKGIKLKE